MPIKDKSLTGDGNRPLIVDSAGQFGTDEAFFLAQAGDNVAALVAAIGATSATVKICGEVQLAANLSVPANIAIEVEKGGEIDRNGFTFTCAGPFRAPRMAVFTGTGTTVLASGSCEFVCPEWFGASTSSSDNTDAFQEALEVASATTSPGSPGIVRTAAGTFVCTGTITMPERIVIWEGAGSDKSVMRHSPASFSDFVVGDTNGEGFVGFRDIRFCGRAYQQGNTRYLINYENFNENCFIENVQMRDSVGFLKIYNGFLSTIRNLRCQAATPNATAAGITNLEWAEVWDDGHAPIHLRGMNGSTVDGLHLYRIGSEAVGGLTPASPILIQATQAFTIRGVQVEGATTYTDGSTYTVRQKSIVVVDGAAGLLIDGFYMEANYSTEHLFHFKSGTQAQLRAITAYNSDCDSSMFYSQSLWDIDVRSGMIYRMRAPTLYKVVQGGFSVQGRIDFDNFMVSPGGIFTDAGLSADAENVNDTYGTSHLLGIADEDELTYSSKRLFTPKRNTGLVVTASSDPTYTGVGVATGHYIQLTGGTFMNENGRIVTVKRPTGNGLSTAFAVFRLRPANASKYYRLYIGEAGNPYLVESNSAFTNDRGNWIAQFRTNASTQIVRYSDGMTAGLDADPYNPRLSVTGFYVPNQSNVQIYAAAAPTSGQWAVGDIAFLTAPVSNAVGMASSLGWVCTTAGSPGTWTKITDAALFVALLGRSGGQIIMGGTGSAESLTLQSTSHATKGFVKFGAAGASVYDETNDRLGLGKTAPASKLHVAGSVDGAFEAARWVNEDSTAASSNEAIRHHYRLRGGGTATDRTAGYMEMRKDGDFGSAGAMDGKFVFAPSIDETPTDMLGIDQNGIDLMTAGKRFKFQEGPIVRAGSGSPEGVLTAPVGSMYHRTDGGAGTSLYVKESGAGNTGWVAK